MNFLSDLRELIEQYEWSSLGDTLSVSFDDPMATWSELTASEEGRIALSAAAALVCILAIVLIIRYRRQTKGQRSLARETRPIRMAGYAIAILFFGGFGTWSPKFNS